MNYYFNFIGHLGSNKIRASVQVWHPWQLKKIKIMGAVLELPAKQHCQVSVFTQKMGQIGSAVQLVHSSKTAPRILILSIAMVADYSFEVKNIEIWEPAFFKHNNSSVATVILLQLSLKNRGILQNKYSRTGCLKNKKTLRMKPKFAPSVLFLLLLSLKTVSI